MVRHARPVRSLYPAEVPEGRLQLRDTAELSSRTGTGAGVPVRPDWRLRAAFRLYQDRSQLRRLFEALRGEFEVKRVSVPNAVSGPV